jgi:WD40 repeat protein
LWNPTTQRQVAVLQQPQTGASNEDLAFSHDGRRFAASNANSIHIWDLAKADEKTTLTGHEGAVPCAAFHPDGQSLVTGGKDNQLLTWDPKTGAPKGALSLGKAGQALAFLPGGEILAVGCMGGASAAPLRLIETRTHETLHRLDPGIGDVHSLASARGRETSLLAACGATGVVLWKVSQGRAKEMNEVMRLNREWCLSTALNNSGTFLVWSQNDWNLQAWDIQAGQPHPLSAPPMFSGWHGVSFLPNGRSIAYVSKSGQLQIWDVVDDRHVNAIGSPQTFNAPHMAVSRDGKWLAALAQPDAVSIWNLPMRKQAFVLRPESGNIWSLAWDPTGDHLAVGQSDGGLSVWHLPKLQTKLAKLGLQWQER